MNKKTYFTLKRRIYSFYVEVVEEFPDAKADKIEIRFFPSRNEIAQCNLLNEEENKKEPKIDIGSKFLSFTERAQKGILAHEIGHYETMKHWTISRIKSHYRWLRMYNLNNIPNSRPYLKERIRKILMLSEMAADNKTVKTKYGMYNLEDYKSRIDTDHNEIGRILIENLERKLKEE